MTEEIRAIVKLPAETLAAIGLRAAIEAGKQEGARPYLPQSPAEAAEFKAHEWVLDAIQAAFVMGQQVGSDGRLYARHDAPPNTGFEPPSIAKMKEQPGLYLVNHPSLPRVITPIWVDARRNVMSMTLDEALSDEGWNRDIEVRGPLRPDQPAI